MHWYEELQQSKLVPITAITLVIPVIIGLFSYILRGKVKQDSPSPSFGILSYMEHKQQFLFHCLWLKDESLAEKYFLPQTRFYGLES